MKAKSMKLRMLITLHTLFKHSDKEHRINSVQLNEFMTPYGLECTGIVLRDTVRVMQEFGIDVRRGGEYNHKGYWINNRPLSDSVLHRIIFAISTNPFLSETQAAELMGELRPLVTVYQEPLLQSTVTRGELTCAEPQLYDNYIAVCSAIREKRRVAYKAVQICCNRATGEVYWKVEADTSFTPRYIYQTKHLIYMVGYNHFDKHMDAVDLQAITDVRPTHWCDNADSDEIKNLLDRCEPRDYVPEERRQLIYKGPAVFRCRGQYVKELVRRFGMPNAPVEKDARFRAVFSVQEAEIWPETLAWLAQVPGHGIRIKGPEALVDAVREYCAATTAVVLDPRIPAKP